MHACFTECRGVPELRYSATCTETRRASQAGNFAESYGDRCDGTGKSAVGDFSSRNASGNSPAHTQRPAAKFVPSHIAEVLLESAIEVAKQRMLEGKTREEKLSAWHEMVALMNQRTPARVRFMERMAGLA